MIAKHQLLIEASGLGWDQISVLIEAQLQHPTENTGGPFAGPIGA